MGGVKLTDTEAYCVDCSLMHPARIERREKRVFGVIECPKGDAEFLLSSDAELYARIRGRSRFSEPDFARELRSGSFRRKAQVYFIDITNSCNFRCPVCYADSGSAPEKKFIGLEDFSARLDIAKAEGARTVTLFGGEPSIHPQVAELVRMARARGFKPIMISNGALLGARPGFAAELKKAGLSQVNIQFDSLESETVKAMRGGDYLDVKLAALENCVNAGLSVELIMTVTKKNIHEMPRILSLALSLGPRVREILFQGVAETGRFEFPRGVTVDREEMMRALIDSKEFGQALSADSFFPIPFLDAWELAMHPDCVVMAAILKDSRGLLTLDRLVDLDALFKKLQRRRKGRGSMAKAATLLSALAASIRRIPLSRLLRLAATFAFHPRVSLAGAAVSAQAKRPARSSFAIVSIESYNAANFQDKDKTDLCPTRQILKDGAVCSCVFNSRKTEDPRSRVSVHARGEFLKRRIFFLLSFSLDKRGVRLNHVGMNPTIFESLFNVAYFLAVWILVILLAGRFSRSPARDKPIEWRCFMAFALLALGDSFHVGARILSSIIGVERAFANVGGVRSSLIGLGMLATSYTITGFYMILTDLRRLRAGEKTDPFFWTMQALLAARLAVMALPGNAWESGASPFAMGLFRNLLLILPGAVLAARFILDGRAFKDRAWTLVGWCMAASFACYAAVILLNDAFPMVGMLMIPKTIAYAIMGIALARRPSPKA